MMRTVSGADIDDAGADRALIESLTKAWDDRWPGTTVIAHRIEAPGRWVRFHSLPESKRYADSEAEYDEILRRHLAVLRELAGATNGAAPSLVVVTCSWSSSSDPVPRDPAVERTCGKALHWRSDLTDDSIPDEETWTHLFVQTLGLNDPRLAALLRLVADYETSGVIITELNCKWLYHPYDGGGDVFAVSSAQREFLAREHADWLSKHPQGL